MKLLTTEQLPRAAHRLDTSILLEAELRPTSWSRLRAKLLVFPTAKALSRWWRKNVGGDLGPGCKGAVNSLISEYWNPETDERYLTADQRFFAVIGLLSRHLSMEVLSHEAVHLGFCYAKRVGRKAFRPAEEFDEEAVAYPAGYMASQMNRILHRHGFLGSK